MKQSSCATPPLPSRHETCQSIHLSHCKLHGRGSELGHRGDLLMACRVSSSRGTPWQTALEAFCFWYSAPNSSRTLWTMNTPANCLRRVDSKTFPLKASYLKSSAASKLLTLRAQHLSKRIPKPRPRPNPNDSFLAAPRGTTTTMTRITFASAEQKRAFARRTRNHARRIDIPTRNWTRSWLPSSRCGGIHRSKRRRVSRLRRVESVFGTAERP